jgi:hypothetical protein
MNNSITKTEYFFIAKVITIFAVCFFIIINICSAKNVKMSGRSLRQVESSGATFSKPTIIMGDGNYKADRKSEAVSEINTAGLNLNYIETNVNSKSSCKRIIKPVRAGWYEVKPENKEKNNNELKNYGVRQLVNLLTRLVGTTVLPFQAAWN